MKRHKIRNSKKIENLEKVIQAELLDLKSEIEEADMLFGNWSKPISSVLLPKDIKYFNEERKRTILKFLHVTDAPQLKNVGEVMNKELEAALKCDFSDNGFPLLLHQFFINRAQSLVQCKHLHLLRWRRFCQHTSVVEKNYDKFKKRLEKIDSEYHDVKQRALRLSKAYDEFIQKNKTSMDSVKSEDIAIYLRWLVSSMHSVRKPICYVRMLQWLPAIHSNLLNSTDSTADKKPAGKNKPDISEDLKKKLSSRRETDFHGFVSDESNHSIPLHTLDLSNFRGQLEVLAREYDIVIKTDLSSPADEMELFGSIIRQFKRFFNLQEDCMTFHPYDCVPDGNEHWGIDSPTHCLLKLSNWTAHVGLYPRKTATEGKQMKWLQQNGRLDELLSYYSSFLKISDHTLVVDFLKQYGAEARSLYSPKCIQVISNKEASRKTSDIWPAFYKNPDIREEFQSGSRTGESQSQRNFDKSDNYDFSNAMQSLGLDESEETSSIDQHVVQGAYLSFLHLRILKLRDMRRQCLAFLNYFRSIERTVTIYNGGLSLEDEPLTPEQTQRSRKNTRRAKSKEFSQKKPDGIGNHSYVNNTPLDFKVDELNFMQFGGIANHDDFYQADESTLEESGDARQQITASSGTGICVPHVQDQRGYFIMYDLALKDFEQMEEELLLVASHFLSKDEDHRADTMHESLKKTKRSKSPDLLSYSHYLVDRFAVLLDIWICQLNFLHSKRELLDCYLEAYGNLFSVDDRRSLSQIITDIIHMKPRYDFSQDYFINMYKVECSCLQLRANLMKRVLNSQIEETRNYVSSLAKARSNFGMPFPPETTQSICLNFPSPALLHMDLLEFHPTLGTSAIQLSEAIRNILEEITQNESSDKLMDLLEKEKLFLELATHEWEEMSSIGSSYSPQIRKEILSSQYSDSPALIEDAIVSALSDTDSNNIAETNNEKEARAQTAWKIALEGVILQNRLREVAWETEILSRLYVRTCKSMGFGESHMYLRLIKLEDATAKSSSDNTCSGILLSPEDANIDRYTSENLMLALQELDTSLLSKFSFHLKSSIVKMINKPEILENIRITLAYQIAHRNSLIVAIDLTDACLQWKASSPSTESTDKTPASDEPSSTDMVCHWFGRSLAKGKGGDSSKRIIYGTPNSKRLKLPFLSVQIEKILPRDTMVNAFVKAKETSGLLLQKEAEVIKLKFKLVEKFCKDYSYGIGLHAMRVQIVSYYSAMIKLLGQIPSLRDTFFVLGRPNEKKRKLDDVAGMVPDPKAMHQRPRQVFSMDGKDFLNLWFIPHFTEIMFSYRFKDQIIQWDFLSCWLEIVSSLHDILQYVFGHATLGNILANPSKTTTSADWGGTEGIGSQLSEIQKQLDQLKSGSTPFTRNPRQVAQFLKLKRDTMFLEFEHGILTYIQKQQKQAYADPSKYKEIAANSHFALKALSSHTHPSLFQMFIHVPHPVCDDEDTSKIIFPWLSFEDSHGRFPLKYRPHWNNVEECMHLCLASLDENERQKMNGELLGSAMIYQDVLKGGVKQLQSINGDLPLTQDGFVAANPIGQKKKGTKSAQRDNEKSAKAATENDVKTEQVADNYFTPDPLSRMEQPVLSYQVTKTYFILCKQLEEVKRYWIGKKLTVEEVSTKPLVLEAERIYLAEIYIPVLQTLAREMGFTDYYGDHFAIDEVPSPPPDTPEITLKARQLIRLLEAIEIEMLKELRHKVSQEMSLVMAERSREETALPTDLWKKGQIKETISIGRPTIVQDFLHQLMGDYVEEGGRISFTTDHLNQCVFNLASSTMNREKQSYELYSTFYENLLRHHHHLLYQKEREIETVRLRSSESSRNRINAQFQLADHNRDLIVEVTALRAAMSEMESHQSKRDALVRQEARTQYQNLIHGLFQECLRMKEKLMQNELSLYEDVASLVNETKNESMDMLKDLRHKTLNSTTNSRLNVLEEKDERMKSLERENAKLKKRIKKLQALHHWRRIALTFRTSRNNQTLYKNFMECKKDLQATQLVSSQDRSILEEQLLCARKAVEKASLDLNQAYDQLEREREEQKERLYREAKQEQKRKHISETQKNSIHRLGVELSEKDKRLMSFLAEKEKYAQASEALNSKTRREMKKYQHQLEVDRALKLEAFNRIDDLQAHLWDFEHMSATVPSRGASAGLGSVSGLDGLAIARATRPSSCFPSYKRAGIEEAKGLLSKRPSTSSARIKSIGSRRKFPGFGTDSVAE